MKGRGVRKEGIWVEVEGKDLSDQRGSWRKGAVEAGEGSWTGIGGELEGSRRVEGSWMGGEDS